MSKPIDAQLPRNRWSLARSAVVLVASALVLGAGVATYVYGAGATQAADGQLIAAESAHADYVAAEEKKRVAAEALEEARRKLVEKREIQQAYDAAYARDGFERAAEGVYYRFAKPSEFRCGYWDCAFVYVITHDGCPNGVYIEAAITRGGTDIGLANHVAAATPPGGTVSAELQDHHGGDGFRLTKINCN